MNVLFCGDRSIEDGVMIAVASLMKNAREPIAVTIFTMEVFTQQKQYFPVSEDFADYLDEYVKKRDPDSSVALVDLTELFKDQPPSANMDTRFTPYCMLRLFSDKVDGMPDRILYLDADVICRRDISDFYNQDMEGYELAGVLDHYGKWFFRRKFWRMDYLNSGVLLLNMEMIRQTHLFEKCREMCQDKGMFMPDQSAINKLARKKKICGRKYNEQKKLHYNTVIQHFTTTFRFFPWVHTQTVKPWQIEMVHRKLRLFEYDDLLEEYKKMKTEREGYIPT